MARVAFVLPFGEPEEAFFADTFLTLLAADTRRAGHTAHVVRVYYDGRDPGKDAAIRARLRQFLEQQSVDLVVVERLFDPEPVLAHVAAAPGRQVLQVTRGDSVEPVAGLRHVLGVLTELVPGRPARRTPTLAGLRHAFRQVLSALERGDDFGGVPGVATLEDGEIRSGEPLRAAAGDAPFDPVVDAHVIAPGAPPRIWQKTLLGNEGCPFADDPMANPHYAGAELPSSLPVARLGCGFCHMGGDYEKRPDAEVVLRLVEQAEYFARELPEIRSFTLSDQHAHRYLESLVRTAAARGLRGTRWLFPARPDAFVRERERIAQAARAAAEVGHVLEVYLSGFEAFSDRELGRYNKGCTRAELLQAVGAMRALREEFPESFEHAAARAHSMILWNPWTSPEDVRESVDAIREHELGELFHEVGRNRLRLYRELPIYWAALRDGATQGAWTQGDEGAARRKGYSSELPWRFLDERTRVAHEVAAGLRDRLGLETELDQLSAALDFAETGGTGWDPVATGLTQLDATLQQFLAPHREADRPARGAQTRAVPCVLRRGTREAELDAALDSAVEQARPLFIAGRDVTTHPRFAALCARARDRALPFGVLLDADLPGARILEALKLGASGVSLRMGPTTPAALVRTGVATEARIRPVAGGLAELPRWASWAASVEVPQLRVEISLSALGLANLAEGADALGMLARECRAHGVALEVAPLAAGLGDFRFVPVAVHHPGKTPRRERPP